MSSDQILVKKPLIFATGSEIRKDIAESHGISCEFIKSEVDEELIKLNFRGNDFDKLAIQLATEKALTISDKNKDYFVVGVDQVCSLDEEILNKPGNKDNAIVSLQKLSGKTHHQNCGMAICKDGKIIWQSSAIAELTMKDLTLDEIQRYLDLDEPYSCSGSYKFEANGKDLFLNVIGSEYTIQGMDIDQLIEAFYREGII